MVSVLAPKGLVTFEQFPKRCFPGDWSESVPTVRDGFVLVKEAASMLGVCPNTIRAWGAAGKLTEYRHPINSYRMFKRKDIESLIARMNKPRRKLPK